MSVREISDAMMLVSRGGKKPQTKEQGRLREDRKDKKKAMSLTKKWPKSKSVPNIVFNISVFMLFSLKSRIRKRNFPDLVIYCYITNHSQQLMMGTILLCTTSVT